MRIFITGATGYIGSVLVQQAIDAGHTVHGLSRSEAGDAKLQAMGATPVRGDLTTPLQGTDKALVITSGSAVEAPDPTGGETTEASPITETFVLKDRARSERHALGWSEKGVRVSALRLAPYVYGRGGSGIAMLMEMAAKASESIYVDEGELRTSSVHVDDAAALYLLAAEKAKAGEVFNTTSANATTFREIAEAIGAALQVPARSVRLEEARTIWGDMVDFVQYQNRASSRKAVEELVAAERN